MVKKFFSVFFLVAALVISTVSAESLCVVNKTNGEITNIKVTFAEGVLNYNNDVCITFLLADQSGTTDFAEEVKYVKVYEVRYTDANGVEFTKNYNGKEFYLPASLDLKNEVHAIDFTHNETAEKEAIEATLLHKASVMAKNAKDTVVNGTKDAASWVADNAKDAYKATKGAAVSVYDSIVGTEKAAQVTQEVAQIVKEEATVVEEKAAEVETEAKLS